MGYTHYWYRPENIDQNTFHDIRADFERLVLPLADAGAAVAGGLGKGAPKITDELIRFNGLEECGHPKNEEIGIPFPSEYAEGIGPSSTAIDNGANGLVTMIKHRCCDGRCSYETFNLPQSVDLERNGEPAENGLYIEFVKTAFRPYDVAVTAALIIAKRHLKDQLIVQSDGSDRQWIDARRICQAVLGYGDWFGIVDEPVVEESLDEPGRKRKVLARTLVELDPATLG